MVIELYRRLISTLSRLLLSSNLLGIESGSDRKYFSAKLSLLARLFAFIQSILSFIRPLSLAPLLCLRSGRTTPAIG